MCRGCDLGITELFMEYHGEYGNVMYQIKKIEHKLHYMKQKCKPEHRKAVDAHHKRIVRLRREYGKLDQEFKL